MHTLADKDDFLYATTDIAIWSCSETGLGITAACCAVLRPLFRKTLVATGFLSSGPMSRMDTPTFASQGNAKNTRRGYKRSSSSEWPEEEVTLQSLKAHGQKPGKDGKGFGTMASVWHPDDDEAGRDAQAGTSPLGAEIMVTRTRDVTRI